MDSTQFCYWLQGYVELGGKPPTKEQWEVVKEHLGLVFNKVTTKTVSVPSQLGFGNPPGIYCSTTPDHNKIFESTVWTGVFSGKSLAGSVLQLEPNWPAVTQIGPSVATC